jgi:predicted metal-dependent phosphoesterase TrpH
MSEVYFKDVEVLKGPVLSMLKKEGYQAVDMHYHSRFSVDGLATVKQVINKCKKDKVGTSFTDHNHVEGSLKAIKIAGKDIFVIPGVELTCHNGVHILLHFSNVNEYKDFYNKEMKKRVKANPWFLDIDHNEAVEVANDYNCLITTPHPYGPGFCGVQKFGITKQTLKKIDAIEVLNGCCIGQMNHLAVKWAQKVNKGFTGGSDGHCLNEHGTSLTICQAETREEFLDQIRKRKSVVIGKEERLLEDGINAVHKFLREEKKVPKKQMEKMWKDRFSLEWNYFKKKMEDNSFFHHFHSHHQDTKKKNLEKHQLTKHLAKK